MSAIRIHYYHSMKTTSALYMLERNSKSLDKHECFGSPSNEETVIAILFGFPRDLFLTYDFLNDGLLVCQILVLYSHHPQMYIVYCNQFYSSFFPI